MNSIKKFHAIRKENSLEIQSSPDKTQERQLAEISLSSVTLNTFTSVNFAKGAMGSVDFTEALNVMRDKTNQVNNGNIEGLEATLTSQAASLDTIFNELARRSCINMGEHLSATESYMRLALKAQAQCARTIEVLATMKNPPVVFAKQANIANGNQQVNNGSFASNPPAHAGEAINQPNELLEVNNGSKKMDTSATKSTKRKNKGMGAMEKFDRC
jgi:hypothetical protein